MRNRNMIITTIIPKFIKSKKEKTLSEKMKMYEKTHKITNKARCKICRRKFKYDELDYHIRYLCDSCREKAKTLSDNDYDDDNNTTEMKMWFILEKYENNQ